MYIPPRSLACFLVAAAGAAAFACGGDRKTVTPTQPAAPVVPAVTLTGIVVGVPGNASSTLAPGDKLQLFALAQYSDATTADVTNVAVWQSSNPVVATVSSGGVLTAAAEGELDVTATHQGRAGSLHARVERPGCRVTLSPSSLTYSAFGGSTYVEVTTTLSDCRWTAKSDASWLPFNFDPNRSGNGVFFYTVPANSGTSPRTANIIVSLTGGSAVTHTVQQERPLGCSYVVTPDKVTLPSSGGTGAFNLVTTPGDCQWIVYNGGASGIVKVTLTGASSGTGAARITYSTASNPFSFDALYDIEVRGLSGQNPPGRHRVTILRGVNTLSR